VQRIARWLQAGRLADLGPLGDGPANLVDVEDVAQAAVLALRHPLAKGQTVAFNLAAPDSPRWNEYFCDLTLALDAGPLQRWGARRLKWEVYVRGVPLKVLERLGSKLKLDTSGWAEGIPPSLMGLWAQQITLSSDAATGALGLKWTPYRETLRQAVAWVDQRER
jgi:nucleoside-diphosphate-sugar epimerase